MAKFLEVYKCNICGNIVETIHAGGGSLTGVAGESTHLSLFTEITAATGGVAQ